MTDIELVIKIPEEIMEYIKNNGCLSVVYNDEVAKAITNGTPYEERPQGEWITRTKDNGVNYHFYCSCCDREVIQITDYCPNCGAKMTKEAENEND